METLCSLFPIDCRFPKLDVAGSIPVPRSILSTTWKHPLSDLLRFAPLLLHLRKAEGFLKRIDGIQATFERGAGVLVLIHVYRVPHLIGPHLRVNPQFIQETRMGAAHHLEVDPLEADLC